MSRSGPKTTPTNHCTFEKEVQGKAAGRIIEFQTTFWKLYEGEKWCWKLSFASTPPPPPPLPLPKKKGQKEPTRTPKKGQQKRLKRTMKKAKKKDQKNGQTRAKNGATQGQKRQRKQKGAKGQKRAPGHGPPATEPQHVANMQTGQMGQTGQTGQIWRCALPSIRYSGNRLPSAMDNAKSIPIPNNASVQFLSPHRAQPRCQDFDGRRLCHGHRAEQGGHHLCDVFTILTEKSLRVEGGGGGGERRGRREGGRGVPLDLSIFLGGGVEGRGAEGCVSGVLCVCVCVWCVVCGVCGVWFVVCVRQHKTGEKWGLSPLAAPHPWRRNVRCHWVSVDWTANSSAIRTSVCYRQGQRGPSTANPTIAEVDPSEKYLCPMASPIGTSWSMCGTTRQLLKLSPQQSRYLLRWWSSASKDCKVKCRDSCWSCRNNNRKSVGGWRLVERKNERKMGKLAEWVSQSGHDDWLLVCCQLEIESEGHVSLRRISVVEGILVSFAHVHW